jgi:hypothetical protein
MTMQRAALITALVSAQPLAQIKNKKQIVQVYEIVRATRRMGYAKSDQFDEDMIADWLVYNIKNSTLESSPTWLAARVGVRAVLGIKK